MQKDMQRVLVLEFQEAWGALVTDTVNLTNSLRNALLG